eukprot:3272745-Rhodomonas_salina.1
MLGVASYPSVPRAGRSSIPISTTQRVAAIRHAASEKRVVSLPPATRPSSQSAPASPHSSSAPAVVTPLASTRSAPTTQRDQERESAIVVQKRACAALGCGRRAARGSEVGREESELYAEADRSMILCVGRYDCAGTGIGKWA